MLSEIPKGFGKIKEEQGNSSDAELIRIGIIAEMDAINLYEQLASQAKDEKVRKVFLEVAREEKTHVGEFFELLKRFDKEQVEELEKGKKEVGETI